MTASVAELDRDGRLLLAEGAAPFGEAPLGDSIFDHADPSSHEEMRASFAQVLTTGQPRRIELRGASRIHGRATLYSALVSPVIEDGVVTSLTLLSTEQSVPVLDDLERATNRTKLELVLEASNMGLWTYDPATSIGAWDAETGRIIGLEHRSGDLGRLLDMVSREDRPRLERAIGEALTHGRFGPIEYQIHAADGVDRWVLNSGARPHGHDIVVGSMLDITERKRQQSALAETQRMESIGRLAGGVAHDFNNMLTVILTCATLARRPVRKPDEVAADLDEIRAAALRSRELTARLLSFARRQPMRPRPTDLGALIDGMRRLLSTTLGSSIELVTTLRATRATEIDPPQVEQLLINLASNACDAMPSGGQLAIETRDVELEPAHAAQLGVATPSCVEIEVRDTGEGIPESLRGHVFEPFFTTKPHGRGTGLGLAQCYGVVKQHGGHIELRSQVGRGTSVRILFPSTGHTVAAPEVVVERERGADETILLAEDDPAIRTVLVRVLSLEGYRVIAACDGQEALTLSRAHVGPIHLVLSDVVMPVLGGLALTAAIRELRPRIAVLLMSGYSEEIARGGTQADVLAKPFSPDELLGRVRAALSASRGGTT